jgi:RHS repeat-associated protein
MTHPAYLRRAALACACAVTTLAQAQTQDTAVSFSYDEMGNLTSIVRPLNRSTSFSYNRFQRMTSESVKLGASSLVTRFGYDGRDQLTSVTDPRNLVTSYAVDGLGNKDSQSSPDTANSSYSYDEVGNLLSATDARGKTTSFSYDLLNRLTQVAYASGQPVVFEYDGGPGGNPGEIGNLTKITDQSGSTTYTHDLRRRVLTKIQRVTHGGGSFEARLAYTYGSSGAATGKDTSMTYPSGARLNYSYDGNGRISALTLNPADGSGGANQLSEVTLLSNIDYTPSGQVKSWTWGIGLPGTAYARTYDLDGRVVTYPVDDQGTVRTVSYNAANLITSYTHTGTPMAASFDQSFGYDLADRLTSYTKGGQTTTYSYDANGNRTAQAGPPISYVFSTTSNRLASASQPGPRSYSYDAAGNRTADGRLVYTYGDHGRLSRIAGSGLTLDFLYNGKGERVVKLGGYLGASYYAYDEAGKTVGEYGAGDSVETVYLGDLPVAAFGPHGQYMVFADHINTPVTLGVGDPMNTPWDWRHRDPFGAEQPIEMVGGPGFFNHRFPGQMADQETGLYYNYHRTYDPMLGRYIESDPIGLDGGINTYAYVNSNPVSAIDPEGLATVHIWNFHGKHNVGHASVTLGDKTHISWWPAVGESPTLFNAVDGQPLSYRSDVRSEGRKPDLTINLDGLDEAAMKEWWEKYKKNQKHYSALAQSCATTAAQALAVGAGQQLPNTSFWTPNSVRAYAEAIKRGSAYGRKATARLPGWN